MQISWGGATENTTGLEYIVGDNDIMRELGISSERHAAPIELCLTISKAEVNLRFPSQKS